MVHVVRTHETLHQLLAELQGLHYGRSRESTGCRNAVLQGRLVCAEGIVTKASVVRPKWVKSVHYCAATGKETTREYRCGPNVQTPV